MKFDNKAITKLAKKYHLRLLMLFGSQVDNKIHPESDLDLAFYSSEKIDEQKLYKELVHLFKRADIDLINLFSMHNHFLRFKILNFGKVLYEESPGLKSKMEWESYFDYVDFKKYYDLRSELLDKKLGEMNG